MKTYYRSLDDHGEAKDEFPAGTTEFDRRDFLKAAGFAVGAAAMTRCARAPVEKAIPFLKAPAGVVPGRPYWIASTCGGCAAGCGVLVKCVDGRPIKLEGNPQHPVSRGGLCAVGQASVLELYDTTRLRAPLVAGKASTWAEADALIASKLASAKRVRVVTSTLASPALEEQIDRFLARFPDGRRVTYDALSCSAIADAHEQTHGVRAIPRYRFDRANVIVSLDADFLGTWISPVEFTKQYASRRQPKDMSWHVQLEGRMSLTGSNADQRLRIRPDEIAIVLSHLAGTPAGELPFKQVVLDRIVRRLEKCRSLIVCGSNNLEDQILTNIVNERLGSYGTTIDIERPSYQRQGNDAQLAGLHSADALFVLGCNPVYDLPHFDTRSIPFVVSLATHVDETAGQAHVVCPDHHFLEAWRDRQPVAGVIAIAQPAIAPLGGTRAAIESFAAWSGTPATAYDLIRARHRDLDWDATLSAGFILSEAKHSPGRRAADPSLLSRLSIRQPQRNKLTLVLYPSTAMLDGAHAHNPWLLELPDPISKITWDNYASFSPPTAKRLGLKDGDVVRVNGVELPAFVQPGQHDDVVAIAIGYGRKGTDRFTSVGPKWLLQRVQFAPGELVGKRVSHLGGEVTIEKTGRFRPLATTQLHNTLEGRDVVRETTLAKWNEKEPEEDFAARTLWPGHAAAVHQWAMAVDLTRCTGCSACVIACQAENNVPVVGKDEVLREREMHWIRIDRYYRGEGDDIDVVHQPVMCQHCGNAPCETVCPVLATVHSSEGLNQQIYNRCVGTRYCANNCPYKARRFNWFDYPHNDRLQNMVLNPDVTVRSRGVMEKCSMCVQRIENGRIEAKRLGIPIADGAIRTACQQSCPADAIVFGDLKDPKSRIGAARRDPRHYRLLEELNVQPGVGYLRRIRNREEA